MSRHHCCVYLGDDLARYSFANDHPFGPMRYQVFAQEFYQQFLQEKVDILPPQKAPQSILELFHTHDYVEQVKQQSRQGIGYLDQGDTPAFIGMYEAASFVVGTVCDAVDRIISNEYQHAFIPIAGLHHARRHIAAGFCVYNDCGVAIEYLRNKYNIQRIAYIDIDAHHGDGVFYSFENDPELIFVDLHEDGHFLYPGTGAESETGKDRAVGTKLNIPMPPHSNDEAFMQAWESVEEFLLKHGADFILLQCGADSIKGDPITHMEYSEKAHAYAAERLCILASQLCHNKFIAMGGGGYNHRNIAKTWTAVVSRMAHKY
ncbi:histone deacetylase [Methyloprofundus sedimenti]|uniref:Acetoin utilization protein AcuC n=1 Tax=Methyloprofundus sedimenti TaxID=1420851 RepID=A0A1V8M554_9GAMM|nr:acetoin utilization protein AcuC [Methyloprofundus sedimenti]OQK16616.1 histone deacetylase [Methyloprofundus sedimenti]